MDVNQLTDLLLSKNKQMEEMMRTARQQKQLHQQIEAYKAEIEQKDQVRWELNYHSIRDFPWTITEDQRWADILFSYPNHWFRIQNWCRLVSK